MSNIVTFAPYYFHCKKCELFLLRHIKFSFTDKPHIEFSLSVEDELVLSDLSDLSLDSSSTNVSPSISTAENTKSIDVQAGPSMIISINSVPSRFPKRRRSSLNEKNRPPPPKTVKIAPFNRATSGGTLSLSQENGQPEIGAVASGKSMICHAVPITGKMISKTKKPPGTEMVSVGKADAFVACLPMSCHGKFAPSQCSIPKQKCSCKAHIRKQEQGLNKSDPMVIDSDDDDDVTIIDEVRPTTTTSSKGKEEKCCLFERTLCLLRHNYTTLFESHQLKLFTY